MTDTESVRLRIPMPPPLSQCFRNANGPGRAKTQRYLTWQRAATNQVLPQKRRLVSGPVAVSVTVAKPDNRKRDLDNLLKPTLDFLVYCNVLADDSQIIDLSIKWGGKKGALVEVMEAEQ